jgi:hypothetical protein
MAAFKMKISKADLSNPPTFEQMVNGDVHPNSTFWHGLSPAAYVHACNKWKEKHPGVAEPTFEDYMAQPDLVDWEGDDNEMPIQK